MHEKHEPHFAFIHRLMKRKSKAKIAETERRFADYLDVCAQIVERQAQQKTESEGENGRLPRPHSAPEHTDR